MSDNTDIPAEIFALIKATRDTQQKREGELGLDTNVNTALPLLQSLLWPSGGSLAELCAWVWQYITHALLLWFIHDASEEAEIMTTPCIDGMSCCWGWKKNPFRTLTRFSEMNEYIVIKVIIRSFVKMRLQHVALSHVEAVTYWGIPSSTEIFLIVHFAGGKHLFRGRIKAVQWTASEMWIEQKQFTACLKYHIQFFHMAFYSVLRRQHIAT